jgi:hypothetical protein
MLLKKGFKFRLDSTDGERQLFAQFAGASRFLYNQCKGVRDSFRYPQGVKVKENNVYKCTYVSNPRFFTQHLSRLRVLARRLSKKIKFSKNWLRAKKQLSKLHARIRHCREDFVHKLSTMIVKSKEKLACLSVLHLFVLIPNWITPFMSIVLRNA